MDRRIVLVVLVLNILQAWSTPRLAHLMNKRGIFCGSKLTDALQLACKGKYNSPAKKSLDGLLGFDEYEDYYGGELVAPEDENQIDFPFLQKESASALLPVRFRRRMGVVDECCRKPCTFRHLTLYCAS